jgi:hypothetical protein
MAIRRTWAALLAAAIFGMNGHAQAPAHQGLTFNGDGALRNNQIHWPKGFEPEQADLFAHNEIDIRVRCETAFSNLVGAEAWPSWYSNSKDVKVLNTPDHRLRKNARISWETFGFHIESRVWESESSSRLGCTDTRDKSFPDRKDEDYGTHIHHRFCGWPRQDGSGAAD